MSQSLFKNEVDITPEWLFYIENESISLSQRDEFAIQNYMDREVFNPEMRGFLSKPDVLTVLDEELEMELMSLNLKEDLMKLSLPDWIRPRYRKLKRKIKRVFCEVVTALEDLDTKAIIKAVILALIPLFATGLPAAVLPILIGLMAYLWKYGISKACPV